MRRTRTDHGELSIGEMVSLTGVTRRTLQYYDRIGVLPAGRDDGGRRVYVPADVTQLQLVRSLVALGFSLDAVQELARSPDAATDRHQLSRHLRLLELEEARVRSRRCVTEAIVRALDSAPGVVLTVGVLPALVDTDVALGSYADLEGVLDGGGTSIDAGDAGQVAAVVETYLRWKSVSVRALVLVENDIAPQSPAGLAVGREWQEYLDLVADGTVPRTVFTRGREQQEAWPEADRSLLARTESYVQACHEAHLRGQS